MTPLKSNISAFLSLVRVGLWENCSEFQVSRFRLQDSIDWEKVYQLAEEQSVIGVALAGIEHSRVKPPQELLLQWIGEVQMLEQQNKSMNQFIAELVEKMRQADIYTLLIKGQGIAQCYERLLWRCCGDVDFLLSEDNYKKAICFLTPLALTVQEENERYKHIAMTIEPWEVELHGTMGCGLWNSIEKGLDEIFDAVIYGGNVRSWIDGKTQVFLPGVDEDVVYVFSHILQHFYKEGIGLRQVCDWCRLLWTYRNTININLLEKRLIRMKAMSEWKAFGALAVEYLGMPHEAMPFYKRSKMLSLKAGRILDFIIETGTFGHNRDYSYYEKYPFLVFKFISLWRHTKDMVRYFAIFPVDSIKLWFGMIKRGVSVAIKGK